MIPKIIHYCWFGGKEKPKSVQRCINSWKLHLPDYEIREWNEDNFDINAYPFAKAAYEKKKFGFTADVARFLALKEYGGIYLDTDVEFIRSMSDTFLHDNAFGCFETGNCVNVGLLGSIREGTFVTAMLEKYTNSLFILNGKPNLAFTSPIAATEYLKDSGFRMDGTFEKHASFTIYSADYFSPKDFKTGLCEITDNTVCIHLYDASWVDEKQQKQNMLKERLIKAVSDCSSIMTHRAIIGLVLRTLNIRSPFDVVRTYLK